MTNFILAKGYDTVYQGTAEVYTVVPESYKKLYPLSFMDDPVRNER